MVSEQCLPSSATISAGRGIAPLVPLKVGTRVRTPLGLLRRSPSPLGVFCYLANRVGG
jgi:hypothetical protein